MALITCPECNTEFSEQQLKNIGMCPSCGLPESEVREHMPPPPPSEPQPKQQTVEKNDDIHNIRPRLQNYLLFSRG